MWLVIAPNLSPCDPMAPPSSLFSNQQWRGFNSTRTPVSTLQGWKKWIVSLPIPSVRGIIQSTGGPRRTKMWREGEFALSAWVGISTFSCPQAWALPTLRPLDWEWIIPALLVLQHTDGQLWANVFNKTLTPLSLSPPSPGIQTQQLIGSLSLESSNILHLRQMDIHQWREDSLYLRKPSLWK